ncbi:hypothetical protein [Actinacidiphila sp. bgisy160]|uniref:hypothetical protein n=1 Tax=Actinacidiphila sp. bgisy160 TaxID=3413796 RepID=UPI003D7235DF
MRAQGTRRLYAVQAAPLRAAARGARRTPAAGAPQETTEPAAAVTATTGFYVPARVDPRYPGTAFALPGLSV